MSTAFTPLPPAPPHGHPQASPHTPTTCDDSKHAEAGQDPEALQNLYSLSDFAESDATSSSTGTHLSVVDPLTVRPRPSSTVLALVVGVALLVAAGTAWVVGVRTVDGQTYDDMVWSDFRSMQPGWFASAADLFGMTLFVPVVSALFALAAIAISVVRRRWWLLGQLAVFGVACGLGAQLKGVLPRTALILMNSPSTNTAPSGHVILAAASSMALMLAVPRAYRALSAAAGVVFTAVTALGLVAQQWHRPTDVMMSILLVAGLAVLTLSATRTNGMDAPGTRMSSASIQIMASAFITVGIVGSLYALYLLWQIQPGLELSAAWTRPGAYFSTTVGVTSMTLLVTGTVLALRQLTASPLSKVGLVGAPPAPPED